MVLRGSRRATGRASYSYISRRSSFGRSKNLNVSRLPTVSPEGSEVGVMVTAKVVACFRGDMGGGGVRQLLGGAGQRRNEVIEAQCYRCPTCPAEFSESSEGGEVAHRRSQQKHATCLTELKKASQLTVELVTDKLRCYVPHLSLVCKLWDALCGWWESHMLDCMPYIDIHKIHAC